MRSQSGRRPAAITIALTAHGGTGTSLGDRPIASRNVANISASETGSGSETMKVRLSVAGLARQNTIACDTLSTDTSERRLRKAPKGSGNGNAATRMIKAMLALAPGP